MTYFPVIVRNELSKVTDKETSTFGRFTMLDYKDPDVHVRTRWMPGAETHIECTVPDTVMYLYSGWIATNASEKQQQQQQNKQNNNNENPTNTITTTVLASAKVLTTLYRFPLDLYQYPLLELLLCSSPYARFTPLCTRRFTCCVMTHCSTHGSVSLCEVWD